MNIKQPMTREKCLGEALNRVAHDREETHSLPGEVEALTAQFWTAYVDVYGPKIRPHDVAAMLLLFEVARFGQSPQDEDGPVTMAGYAACAAELAP